MRQVKNWVEKSGCDCVLLGGTDPGLFYCLGEELENAVLLLFPKKRPILIASPLEKPRGVGCQVIVSRDKEKTVGEIMKQQKIRIVGVNLSRLSAQTCRSLERVCRVKEVNEGLLQLRMVKSADEERILLEAGLITARIMNRLIATLHRRKFGTEGEIKMFLKMETLKEGCSWSFEPIVASGRGAAIPHYVGDKALARGFLVVDFGIKFEGYCTDMTRTFFIGTPSVKEQKVYELVRSCQEKSRVFMESRLAKGVRGDEVDAYARSILGKQAKYLPHSLGHGVGVEVHEYPLLSAKKKHVLKRGMVVTIEPGIYRDFGIRIEDQYILGGPVITAGVTKELLHFQKQKV